MNKYLLFLFFMPFHLAASYDEGIEHFKFSGTGSHEKSLVVDGPSFSHKGLCMKDRVILTLYNNRVTSSKPIQLFQAQIAGSECAELDREQAVLYLGKLGDINFEIYNTKLSKLKSWCDNSDRDFCSDYKVKEFHLGLDGQVRIVVFGTGGRSYSVEFSPGKDVFVGRLFD
ncbi:MULTISPECIES: hypothetical protein [Idiomarinaceae]|uniref:Uncharacterized protein n=2 Tax=Pseudidiomarina TaxID=2800384 RepID=A0AB39X9Y0_9GAMM|nr:MULTISPECIES: hypothetical protein [Idiomarinaceae]MDT7527004.1 hypothetical protein [Pseudidiomarina sp. GXY010]MRJ40662.1 hypothetical protein [Idiomarina sp. FeN1]NCU58616.1 hypothetical protein [Idiomarina sp. FenA--70]NCU61313.1 hypothetical protein [Idiomarina sp. FenBw--71]UUN14647.1 hypothetical protein KGF88_05435 [Idiomarina loihiensis]